MASTRCPPRILRCRSSRDWRASTVPGCTWTMLMVLASSASMASAIAGLKISQDDEGATIRRRLLSLTRQLVSGARTLGFAVDNNELFPLVSVKIGAVPDVVKACNI